MKRKTFPFPPSLYEKWFFFVLEKGIFVLFSNLIVRVVLIAITKELCLLFLCIHFFLLVTFGLSLLCLSLDFSFRRLHFIVLQNVARLDDIRQGIHVQRIRRFLDQFIDQSFGPVNFSVILFVFVARMCLCVCVCICVCICICIGWLDRGDWYMVIEIIEQSRKSHS